MVNKVSNVFHITQMLNSFKTLPKNLQRQYTYLRIYSWFWWGFFALFLIFRPLYLVTIGLPLWAIFLNGALEAIITFLFQNYWSQKCDATQHFKKYILLGNLFRVVGCFYVLAITNIWGIFLLTFIVRAGPSPDILTTVMVYRLSDKCNTDTSQVSEIEKKYHNINLFAQYRKYGSIGWAVIAPLGGLLINYFDFGLNFIIAGFGFLILSIWMHFTFDTSEYIKLNEKNKPNTAYRSDPKADLTTKANSDSNSKQNSEANSDTNSDTNSEANTNKKHVKLFDLKETSSTMKSVLNNRTYRMYMLAFFFFSTATTITFQTQGIFYGLFAPNNYFMVAMTYSIAAFVEFPVMSYVAKRVKTTGWEKIVTISYILTVIRFIITPLLLIINGNIWWAYTISISTGVIFGLRLPASTFGVYSTLDKSQQTFGQSFKYVVSILGSFIGSIVGALIAYLIKDNITNTFIIIYWFAAVLALLGTLFFMKIGKKSQ